MAFFYCSAHQYRVSVSCCTMFGILGAWPLAPQSVLDATVHSFNNNNNNNKYNKLCAWRHNMPLPRPLYARSGPAPVHSLHALRLRRPAHLAPWIFVIDRQRLALGGGVETGLVDIYYVVTWTANQSGLVTLTFDLLSLKVVSESRVTCATSVPILVFLSFDLGPLYATDVRLTDVRQNHRLMPHLLRRGHNNNNNNKYVNTPKFWGPATLRCGYGWPGVIVEICQKMLTAHGIDTRNHGIAGIDTDRSTTYDFL